jgi:hypothetical protein
MGYRLGMPTKRSTLSTEVFNTLMSNPFWKLEDEACAAAIQLPCRLGRFPLQHGLCKHA